MEMQDAIGILINAQTLLSKLEAQRDSLLNHSPCGPMGIPAFDRIEDVLDCVRICRTSILNTRKEIDRIRMEQASTATARELRQIDSELRIIAEDLKL